jgi:hypothetical protein
MIKGKKERVGVALQPVLEISEKWIHSLIELVEVSGLAKAFLHKRLGNRRSTTFSPRLPSPEIAESCTIPSLDFRWLHEAIKVFLLIQEL